MSVCHLYFFVELLDLSIDKVWLTLFGYPDHPYGPVVRMEELLDTLDRLSSFTPELCVLFEGGILEDSSRK